MTFGSLHENVQGKDGEAMDALQTAYRESPTGAEVANIRHYCYNTEKVELFSCFVYARKECIFVS